MPKLFRKFQDIFVQNNFVPKATLRLNNRVAEIYLTCTYAVYYYITSSRSFSGLDQAKVTLLTCFCSLLVATTLALLLA